MISIVKVSLLLLKYDNWVVFPPLVICERKRLPQIIWTGEIVAAILFDRGPSFGARFQFFLRSNLKKRR